jgi:hypothetical protein
VEAGISTLGAEIPGLDFYTTGNVSKEASDE